MSKQTQYNITTLRNKNIVRVDLVKSTRDALTEYKNNHQLNTYDDAVKKLLNIDNKDVDTTN